MSCLIPFRLYVGNSIAVHPPTVFSLDEPALYYAGTSLYANFENGLKKELVYQQLKELYQYWWLSPYGVVMCRLYSLP